MTRFGAQALTRADIRKIEEALNCDDLEVMVAAVDQIVARRLKAARHHQEDRQATARRKECRR